MSEKEERKAREWEKGVASPIPASEYKRFKEKLGEYSKEYSNRNTTLFILAIATGYRMQDLVNLTIGDIKDAISEEKFIIQEQKQYKQWQSALAKYPKRKKPEPRLWPIEKELEKYLKEYVKGKKRSQYAFISNKGDGNEHVTQKSFSKILNQVGKSIGLKNISGHSPRKTFATKIYDESGKDLVQAQEALGHKSVEETKRYLGLKEQKREESAEIAARGL